ncbi:clumping factor B-like [Planococcus citri]|uniref:clumping factor B-like n=1 Tax=Planococcus citri TaxID=170843 RepID=UPI0031F7E4F4
MEVAFEPLQINDISTMAKSCVVEDNSIYEECSICCESFTNKSFINECLHPFCYQCILDWTKVKAVCPLCIGPITGILHNIRSQDDYDIEKVEPPRVDVLANIDNDLIFDIDDTDTDSSYGGMESMDMESDYDNSIIYDGNEDFDGANYDNETGNFFNYLSNNELSHDDDDEASEHSNENEEESEDEAEGDAEEDDASCNNSSDQEEEDDDDEVQNDEFFNVDSESDAEDEHADDEYDCDSNDGDNDADSDNDNDYFDNYEQDDDNDDDDDDDEDGEEEPDNDDSDEDNDDNDYEDTLDAETYDVSDDDSEEPGVEYSPSSASEDEYYY